MGSSKIKMGAAAQAQGQSQESEGEGIGYAQTDRTGNGRLGLGFGLEGYALRNMQEELAQSAVKSTGSAAQSEKAAGAITAAVQTAATAQTQAAEHMVTPEQKREPLREEQALARSARESTTVLATGRGNIRNRLRDSAAKLWEFYQKQKEKAVKLSFWKNKSQPPKKKAVKGTRMADREAVLSMQAENHYLLDSYDSKGNYSMLGK